MLAGGGEERGSDRASSKVSCSDYEWEKVGKERWILSSVVSVNEELKSESVYVTGVSVLPTHLHVQVVVVGGREGLMMFVIHVFWCRRHSYEGEIWLSKTPALRQFLPTSPKSSPQFRLVPLWNVWWGDVMCDEGMWCVLRDVMCDEGCDVCWGDVICWLVCDCRRSQSLLTFLLLT